MDLKLKADTVLAVWKEAKTINVSARNLENKWLIRISRATAIVYSITNTTIRERNMNHVRTEYKQK